MRFFKKHLTLISLVVLPVLFTILSMEAAHHHGRLEANDHCALCVWQQSGAQAPSASAPPLLAQFFLFVFSLVYAPTFVSSFKSFPSLGRAPPQNLL